MKNLPLTTEPSISFETSSSYVNIIGEDYSRKNI